MPVTTLGAIAPYHIVQRVIADRAPEPLVFDKSANMIEPFVFAFGKQARYGESGATRTPFPAQGGQQSGDCGQQVMAA